WSFVVLFFFQAEDGIRDRNVTGVQTCALPISAASSPVAWTEPRCSPVPAVSSQRTTCTRESSSPATYTYLSHTAMWRGPVPAGKIGRASCRGRVGTAVEGGPCDR